MRPELARWKSDGHLFDFLGFDVFYRVDGRPVSEGPHLLAIHGYPFNSFDWAPIWPALTERFCVVAPDMLGMGFSDKPAVHRYTVAEHADVHEALLAELGVRSAHVLAHDLGDSVAQELLARKHSGGQSYGQWEIESLTFLNGGLFHEAYTPRLMQKLMSGTPLGDAMSPLQGSPLSRRLLESTINEMFGPNTKPSRELMDTFHEILEYHDGKRVLHKVGRFLDDRAVHRNRWVRAMRETTVSLRLIDGPVDPNSGAHMARRYREVVPAADVVMLADDIGHWPQIEAPDAVLEHLLAHIDRVTARR